MKRENLVVGIGAGVFLWYLWTRNRELTNDVPLLTYEDPDAYQPVPYSPSWLDDVIDTGIEFMNSPIQALQDAFGPLKRGERINNPGNLRKSANTWVGLSPDQSHDTSFAAFIAPEYGIRAMAKLLVNYGHKGFNTIASILNRYAPQSDNNNTTAYIQAVQYAMNVGADTPLDLSDRDTLKSLVNAIIAHEQGRNIYEPTGLVDKGLDLL
jgi:hypothetical protein